MRLPAKPGEGPPRSGRGRSAAGLAGVGALVVAAVLAALVLFGGAGGHSYRLAFETGGQLVPGNQVLVGGQAIGSIDEITLTDDARAQIEISVEGPLHEGTAATVRASSLSGVANRYISISPGPNSEAEIPDGGLIDAASTTSPVDLDQLFNTLDARTRRSLQDVIEGQATVYTGNNAAARQTYRYFAPGLQATERLLAELTRDQQSLARFLVQGSAALGAIAERRGDLASLTENANRALGAIASRNAELDRSLVALPPAMRQANTTFVNLRAALDDLDPLISDLGAVAPQLPGFLRRTASVADAATPVISDLRLTVARPGPDNDLGDTLADLPRGERAARRSVAPTIRGLDAAQETVDFAVPYTPDLLAFVSKLGQVTAFYDGQGHYARVLPAASNLFDYDPATQGLVPIPPEAQFTDLASLGLGPFTRCPGAATQANPGFPSPADHPFLGGGTLDGGCDPGDVPPGP